MSPFVDAPVAMRLPRDRVRDRKPPRFWLAVVASSVGLHLGTGLLAPLWWRSLSPKSSSSAPLPIEIVDAPAVGSVALDPTDALGTPPITAGSSPMAPVPSTPETIPAPLPTPIEQPITPAPTPLATAPQPPVPVPNPVLPPQEIPPQEIPTPGDRVLPSPVWPPENTSPSGDPGPTTDTTLPPGSFPEVGDPGGGSVIGTGEQPGSGTGEESLPEFGIGQTVEPVQVVANLVDITPIPPEQTHDLPQENAVPLETALTVTADPSSCVIPPESVAAFGQTVALRLVIDGDGQVIDAVEPTPGVNPAYGELARCLVVRRWPFQPARSEGLPRTSDNLIMSLTIQRLP